MGEAPFEMNQSTGLVVLMVRVGDGPARTCSVEQLPLVKLMSLALAPLTETKYVPAASEPGITKPILSVVPMTVCTVEATAVAGEPPQVAERDTCTLAGEIA